MKEKQFLVVNSFTNSSFKGNPAAVVFDTKDFLDEILQQIARQFNLVETVFVNPVIDRGNEFQLRYFTPQQELDIAGHPTVAAFVALYQENHIDIDKYKSFFIHTRKGKQEIKVELEEDRPVITMEQPIAHFLPVYSYREKVAEVLGISFEDIHDSLPIQPVDTGLGHLIVPVKTKGSLMRISRNMKPLKELCQENEIREVQAFTFLEEKLVYTRNICPREGLEDPACGSGNGALGAYLHKNYYTILDEVEIKAEQGEIVNMNSLIRIKVKKDNNNYQAFLKGGGKVMIKGVIYIE